MPLQLLAIGDSAFQAPSQPLDGEAVDPLVMRAFVLALAHRRTASDGKPGYLVQVIDYAGGKQSHVSRGVWSSECFNLRDALDSAILLLGYFEELRKGS